jgi:hypothetical protein
MGKEAKRNDQKNQLLVDFQNFMSEKYNIDVLRVGPSELAIPAVDDEGNEYFNLLKLSVPRGTRNGEGGYTPYDGYAAAEDYKFELEEKAAKKAANEAKKAAAEKAKEAKREAKKVVKELNQKGLKGMIESAE